MVPKEGGTLWIDNLAIPKGARHLDSAYAFLDYVMEPEVAAKIVNGVHYAGANRAALPLIDAKIRQDPAIYPAEGDPRPLRADRGPREDHPAHRRAVDGGEGAVRPTAAA